MREFLREPNWAHGNFFFWLTIFRSHLMILKVICLNTQTTPNVSEYIFNQEYTSSLQDVTNCIVNWSTYNKFELNPTKLNARRLWLTFNVINGINVERVEKAMILGLLITQDMKWNAHVDKITTKAAKRLYLMKQLKRSGLSDNDLNIHVKYFITISRNISQTK